VLLPSPFVQAAAEDVSSAILKPAGGPEPAIFYKADAGTNAGIGDMGWVAVSGSKLSRKGKDPWGNPEGAFGLPEDAKSGTAISGATQSNLLAGPGGAVVIFFKGSDSAGAVSGILSRGPWQTEKPVFDLRSTGGAASRVKLYSGNGSVSPTLVDLGYLEPGGWNFIAFTWTATEGGYLLKSYVAPLANGATLEEKQSNIPAVGATGMQINLAGRYAPSPTYPVDQLLLNQGLFTHVAIYQDSLPDTAIRAIFEASLKGLAH
jgi:hypothetical protein